MAPATNLYTTSISTYRARPALRWSVFGRFTGTARLCESIYVIGWFGIYTSPISTPTIPSTEFQLNTL